MPDPKDEPIAIIGMSCRLPHCPTLEDFWKLLEEGRSAYGKAPGHRFLESDYPFKIPESQKNMVAGFIQDRVDEFDAAFFGMSPKEAVFLDPQQRILLELVWEALEDAGLDPASLRGTNGSVFTGSWGEDYRDLLLKCGTVDFYRRIMGNSIGAASARIALLLGLTGPTISTDSACSSTMVAVHMACKHLQLRETNLALVGGVNLLIKPFDDKDIAGVLSPEGRSKPFDVKADGYGRAEGGGVLVLKRLSEALAEKNKIWGIIRGSSVSQEGLTKSMGTPTVYSESLAMEQAIRKSGLDPSAVSYVEAHGTGTQVGDPIEIEAIGKAYRSEKRKEPLVISSVKGNIGHTESSSGIVGIIKVLLCMKHGKIPKQVGLNELNPALDLGSIPADIPRELREWKVAPGMKRIAGVSSFGITGTDGHVVIEEPMAINYGCVSEVPQRPFYLMKVSAKHEESLDRLLISFKEKFRTGSESFQDLVYSANTGRTDFKHRACIVAGTKEEFASCIDQNRILRGEEAAPMKICFLFSGQGSQYAGMAKQLYETSPVFKLHFDKCLEILEGMGWMNLKEILWGPQGSDMSTPQYSQLALFLVQYGLIKLWESWGVKPDYCLGHSLGEYAAATCCGIHSLETVLELLSIRSRLSSELPDGKMLAVQGNHEQVGKIMEVFIKQYPSMAAIDFAVFNSESQTVVSGDPKSVTGFANFCKEKGVKTTFLSTNLGYHSRQMEPLVPRFKELVNRVPLRSPGHRCKFISSVKARLLLETEMELGAVYWTENIRNSVRFLEASKAAVREGCNVFIEIGPHPVLSTLMVINNESEELTCLPSLTRNGGDDWQTLLTSLGKFYVRGGYVNWKGVMELPPRELVPIPHYPFHRKRYWPETDLANFGVTESTNFHPMLGHPLKNPLGGVTLHQSHVSTKSLQFLQDHCIGHRVICPGAGFLEMSLAAAVQATSSLSRQITIRDFKIRAPLPLPDANFVELQTVVKPSTGNRNEFNIETYHRKNSDEVTTDKWVHHTEATFDLGSNSATDEIKKRLTLNFPRDWKGDEIQEFYKNLDNTGLRFGPHFRSLKEAWLVDKTCGYYILEVDNPQDQSGTKGGSCSYHVHPVVLDAMIQATMFAVFNGPRNEKERKKKGVFSVPVKIGKFVWFPSQGSSEVNAFHIHVIPKSIEVLGSSNQYTAVLLDPNGNVRCLMESVEFVETTLRSFEMALARQINTSADLWEEKWVEVEFPKPGNLGEPGGLWLIFRPDETLFIKNLMGKLEASGKQVIVPSEVDVDIFKKKGKEVEGVIYCGALNRNLKSPAEILEPLLKLTKSMLKSFQKKIPKLVVMTQDALNLDENGDLTGFWRSTVWSFCKSLGNEAMDLKYSCIDTCSKDPVQDATVDAVIHEILSDSRESWVALRKSKRYVPKLSLWRPISKEQRDLSLPPGTNRFQLALPDSRSIQDLRFRELAEFEMGGFDVEVEVKATALNFKDVLTVLKPSDEFKNLNSLGFDFAGIIRKTGKAVTRWREGDLVFGNIRSGRALPSHVQIHEDHLVPVPGNMTYCEAATLPTVFYTAYYCLVEVAKVKKNKTVLIHTASGGVGLVAIQICQSIGATVIATAGSEMKRRYLKSLGVQHVFSSRDIRYFDGILKATEGKGVDVVLNSLTSEGFKEATLGSCANGARFVEMSKLNVWNEQEVKAIRPDVKYDIIDITYLEHETSKRLATKLDEYLGLGIVRPLPYLRYDAVNIRQALGYLQKAKHVGKVVVSMPQFRTTEEGYSEAIPLLFEDRGSYLITGGLGGIGLQVCEWMLSKGARNIVLAGLSPPKEDIAKRIQEMNETFEGAKVVAVQADVANFEECETLIKSKLKKLGLPPLKGIMHAAGALADGLIMNQTWDYLKRPLGAKVDGTLNLHELTKDMNLEYFVLFSSFASILGTRGQSVYAAANQFQDGFAHYRRSLGLPATTVNWCPWGETGMAVDLEFPGFRPLSNGEGLEVLEIALREHRVQTIVMNVELLSSAQNFVPTLTSYLDEETKIRLGRDREVHKPSSSSAIAPLIRGDLFWQQFDSCETPEAKLDCFRKCVKAILKQVLKMGENDDIKDDVDFHELGVDSLMFIEIRNGIQTVFGEKITISVAEIQDNSSLNKLSMVLCKSVS